MMKKYKWNVFEIRKNISTLQSLLKDDGYQFEKKLISDTILQYQNMLKIISNNFNDTLDFNNDMSLHECMLEYTAVLDDSCLPIIELVLDSFELVKDIQSNCEVDYIVNYDNNYLMEITNDFLDDTLPKKYLKIYNSYIKSNPDYLHIQKNSLNSSGMLFIDSVLSNKYVMVNRNNTLWDLVTPSHEFFHLVFNDFSSYLTFDNLMSFTTEIDGSLANLLFIDWIKKKLPKEASSLENDILIFYQMRVLSLMLLNIYFYSLNSKSIFNSSLFYEECKKINYHHEIDIQTVKKLWNDEGAEDSITYTISDLAAIDIHNIYKKDPDYAFYLLSKIRSIRSSDDPIKVLRDNNITFMDDNFYNFKKYIKNIKN